MFLLFFIIIFYTSALRNFQLLAIIVAQLFKTYIIYLYRLSIYRS